MRRRTSSGVFSLLVLGQLEAACAVSEAKPVEGSVASSYCQTLAMIRPGEKIPIVVSGVYQVSYEVRAFFDPADPTCGGQVQPASWVDFSSDRESSAELVRLLKTSRRALVTFEGVIERSEAVAPDDPSIPFAASLSARKANQRYGHGNLFRTRLIVNAVRDVRAVPEDVPWQWGGKPQSSSAEGPIPVQLSPLGYPEVAKELGIGGEVKLEVTVGNGEIQQTRLLSGDRVLGREAERWIRTWRYPPEVSAKFTTLIVYSLERRDPGDEGDRVLLQLPLRAEIRGAQLDW